MIYKKGDPNDPANFRPITLQPSWYKVFSSVYATSIHDFLTKNHYIERNMQKGFWRGVDGVTEHTEMLAHLIKSAKREQRSLVVCLLDLRNAFGEVHHNLTEAALNYHHLPIEILNIFKSIYDQNGIVVSVNKRVTKPIIVERGVLQGDPCSPLLFNMCFNTLMQMLGQPTYRKLGFSYDSKNRHQQRAWLQFVDDAVIVASDNANAQGLLNAFKSWCAWSGMQLRLDKCVAFGMQKRYMVIHK